MGNNKKIIKQFQSIVGSKNVITHPSKTLFYRKGFRFGKGGAIAVVTPGTVLEQWLVIKVCVEMN
jgi:D-lactate dehydrogenase